MKYAVKTIIFLTIVVVIIIHVGCSSSSNKNVYDDYQGEDSDFQIPPKVIQKIQKLPIRTKPLEDLTPRHPLPPIRESKLAQKIEVLPIDQPMKRAVSFELYRNPQRQLLLSVAYDIYGDYRKWKELKKLNPMLKDGAIAKGVKIKYIPAEKVVKKKYRGRPMKVKAGDTIDKLSQKCFGTRNKWRDLYRHNKPFLRRSHLVFEGTTIYCPKKK